MKVIYQGDVGEVSRPVSSIKPSRLSYLPSRGKRHTVLLVDPRPLIRQCFLQGLEANASDLRVISAADPAEISADAVPSGAAHLVLLSIASADVTTPQAAKAIDTIEEKLPEAPIVVLSDREETDAVVAAVCRGVRGYIPTSLDLALVSGALRLVGALGLYTGDHDLAEECAQEALTRACRDWRRVSAMEAPGACHEALAECAGRGARRHVPAAAAWQCLRRVSERSFISTSAMP
jgi:response regulator RpfG family c-di-GMP phosphodiesterase